MSQLLSTAWGKVGTATSGVTEARKYENFEEFMERYATLVEQVENLKQVHAAETGVQGQSYGARTAIGVGQ